MKVILKIIHDHQNSLSNWLTHCSLMLHFYTPWKHQKIHSFLTFSGGKEMLNWTNMG